MDEKFRKQLEAGGWKVGTVQEFLGLSDEEAAYVEIRLALSGTLKARRAQIGLTQKQLADRMESSQSRVAKMEASDSSVSLDLLVRGLLATGATPQDIAASVASAAGPLAEG